MADDIVTPTQVRAGLTASHAWRRLRTLTYEYLFNILNEYSEPQPTPCCCASRHILDAATPDANRDLKLPRRHEHGFRGILVRVSTPARAPQPRGKSPGRPVGYRPQPPL